MGAGLRVGTAYPDRPFNAMPGHTGLDIELMTELASALGEPVEFVAYDSAGLRDLEGIFDRLAAGEYDCIASGIAVTPSRELKAKFVAPYLISGQALAVDTGRHTHVCSVDDLGGMTIGVLRGDTGDSVAERLVAEGRAAGVRFYDFGTPDAAIEDLGSGACGAVMALAPVLAELVASTRTSHPGVRVIQQGLSVERIAIAVSPAEQALADMLGVAQADLEADGTLQRIRRRWLGKPYIDQSVAAL